jgi:hypothetical protein
MCAPFLTNSLGSGPSHNRFASTVPWRSPKLPCHVVEKAKPRNSALPMTSRQLIVARKLASPDVVVALGLLGPLPPPTPGVTAEDAPRSFCDVVVGPAASVVVMSPMTKTVCDAPTVPIEIGMFPTVIAWPGARVWPARTYFVVPSTTVVAISTAAVVAWAARAGAAGRVVVVSPATSTVLPAESTESATTTLSMVAGVPGVSVAEPTT